MLCSLSVISNSKGSHPLLDNKITGLIISTEQQLTLKTIKLLKNEKLRDKVVTNARILDEEKIQ